MRTGATTYLAFLQTVPGLEALLARELEGFGIATKVQLGGVLGRVTLEQLYDACLSSRIAEHVRVRLKPFTATDFRGLREGIRKLNLHAYLPVGHALAVKVTCHKSRLWHSGAVEERVKLELADRGHTFDDEDDDAFALYVRLTDDEVTVSVDASGPRLSRRGFRKFVEKASLRESLAAAVVRVAFAETILGEEVTLFDPFVGAGTLLLEGYDAALGAPAGRRRSFAFERWPTFSASAFSAVKERAAGRATPRRVRLIGSDLTEKAIRSSRANLESIGAPDVTLVCDDFARVARDVPEGAFVLTNPPYGKRLKEEDTGARLVDLLQRRRDLRPAVILAGGALDEQLAEYRALFTTESGGLRVKARLFPVGGAVG